MTDQATAPGAIGLEDRVAALTLEQKVRLLTGADFWSLHPEPAAGLRRLVVSDGPAGVRGERWDERDPSANVPSPTALAATWDPDRVERLGGLLAGEARAKGVDVLLAPTVNLHRTPYGGRHFECFSEDPLLTGAIGAGYVRGLQAAGVAATVKHVVANDSETERFTADVRVGARALRELYLAPFEVIVREAGAWAVMAAYNAVDGTTMTESPMLREILHGEWGFDGVTMSDWFAARSTEAAAAGGLDLVMPGPDGPWGEALVEAVRDGRVPAAAVDDKVLRILRLAARVGALDGTGPATPAAAPWPPDGVAAELRATAAAGFVLTRNDGVLPLDVRALDRVAVLGPNAAHARTLGGGSATVFPAYTVAPLDGVRAALGADGVEVVHAAGVHPSGRIPASVEGLTRPDGAPGVRVRFLAADGHELGAEDRTAAAFTWMGSVLPGVPLADVDVIEVSGRFRAPADGEYLFGASGLGPFELLLGGRPALAETVTLPAGADPVEGIMRPPQVSVPRGLAAGEELDLVLRHRPSPAAGFADAGAGMTTFQLNTGPRHDEERELERAVAAAAAADVAVLVVGTTEEVESEGFDRGSLALPGRQDELVRRVAAVNPRTVVVVNSGAPVLLPWADDVAAVLLCWFPGQEFGNALADVLLGLAEPGGRLPTTWPATEDGLPSARPVDGVLRYDEGLLIGYRRFDRDGREPRHAFGHGLGYTTWEYLDAAVAEREDGGADLTVRVRNTGARGGRDVVQVYASRPGSSVERPDRWLAGFAGVTAGPGEEAEVTVRLPARAFEHWDEASAGWTREPGGFGLAVGPSSRTLPLTVQLPG